MVDFSIPRNRYAEAMPTWPCGNGMESRGRLMDASDTDMHRSSTMFELELPSLAPRAVTALQVLFIIFATVTYIVIKIIWVTMGLPVVEHEQENGPSEPETSKLAPSGKECPGDGQGQSVQHRATRRPVVIWAVLILPINLAAWYVVNVAWQKGLDDKIVTWKGLPLHMASGGPVIASLHVFLHAHVFPPTGTPVPWSAATARALLLRVWLLDGVLLAPASAAYAVYLFPERMLGSCCPLVWAAVYALQAFVWAYFYRVSWPESQARVLV